MIVLVMDTETGGLLSDYHSCLSVGFAVFDLDTGEIKDTYESLVKYPSLDEYKVTDKSLEINGLSVNECFNNGNTIENIQDKFMEMFSMYQCTMLAGHNTIFDIDFIANQIFKVNREQFFAMIKTYRYLDSMSLIRLLDGHNDIKSGASLSKCVSSLNIKMSDFKGRYHTALYDAICTGRILHRFRQILLQTSLNKFN